MLLRCLGLSLLALLPALAHADVGGGIDDPQPADAPTACYAPDGADGLAPLLARGPKVLGRYVLENNKVLDTPWLRLRAYGEFIPERMGSTKGEVQARFEASVLPEVKRDGATYKNTEFTTAPDSLRIRNWRVTTTIKTTKPLRYDAVIEEVGCPRMGTRPPLQPGETLRMWMSTEGLHEYHFGGYRPPTEPGNYPLFYLTFRGGLAPQVQQDTPDPHGYISFGAGNGSIYPEASKDLPGAKMAGAKFTLHGYRVEIEKVVLGKDTRSDDEGYRLYTKGKDPIAHVLVKVTKLADPK